MKHNVVMVNMLHMVHVRLTSAKRTRIEVKNKMYLNYIMLHLKLQSFAVQKQNSLNYENRTKTVGAVVITIIWHLPPVIFAFLTNFMDIFFL